MKVENFFVNITNKVVSSQKKNKNINECEQTPMSTECTLIQHLIKQYLHFLLLLDVTNNYSNLHKAANRTPGIITFKTIDMSIFHENN
jgi:hypothetical protein